MLLFECTHKIKNEIEKPSNLPILSMVYTHKTENNIGMHSLNWKRDWKTFKFSNVVVGMHSQNKN